MILISVTSLFSIFTQYFNLRLVAEIVTYVDFFYISLFKCQEMYINIIVDIKVSEFTEFPLLLIKFSTLKF